MKEVGWSFLFTLSLIQNLLYLFSSHHEGKIYSGEAVLKSAWKDKLYPEEQTAWYGSQRDAAPILSQSCWPLERYTVFRLHCINLQIIPLLKPLQKSHIYGQKSLAEVYCKKKWYCKKTDNILGPKDFELKFILKNTFIKWNNINIPPYRSTKMSFVPL